ncbi:carboxypeptidase B-like [Diadema antillarum]|uniref:carboxypeptidase B-like n=1 Tax=Diadema antillarum TaxID=105358 RepID=UPI003A892917
MGHPSILPRGLPYALLVLAAILAVCSALPLSCKVRYDNYKVFRMTPKSETELKWIKEVAANWEMLDFWRRPSRVGQSVDVMVPPALHLDVLQAFARPGLSIETWISDVQSLIDEEAAEMVRAKGVLRPEDFDYFTYNEYSEIDAWMSDFASANPGVTKIPVTTTYEKETVYGLRIDMSSSATNVAYIQGGIHAREWISVATMINMVRMFNESYGNDDTVTSMLDNFVWIIVPVFNVDGYKYSHTDDRMWRKNRNLNNGGCKGVDLNRNFDYQWGGAGNSKCVQDYQGPSALSEPETSGSKDFLTSFGSNLKLYIDFHAYGQYWLHPWGYTDRKLTAHPDRDQQYNVAVQIEKSISSVHGKRYFVGESGPDLYPATGASEDFGYGSLGVLYSYLVELRDQGRYGFELPANQIQPTAEEIFAGMKTLGQQLVNEYA